MASSLNGSFCRAFPFLLDFGAMAGSIYAFQSIQPNIGLNCEPYEDPKQAQHIPAPSDRKRRCYSHSDDFYVGLLLIHFG
jgi:hypothetical protein